MLDPKGEKKKVEEKVQLLSPENSVEREIFNKLELIPDCSSATSRSCENGDLKPREKKLLQKIVREQLKKDIGSGNEITLLM